jgi:hypothetical protein
VGFEKLMVGALQMGSLEVAGPASDAAELRVGNSSAATNIAFMLWSLKRNKFNGTDLQNAAMVVNQTHATGSSKTLALSCPSRVWIGRRMARQRQATILVAIARELKEE